MPGGTGESELKKIAMKIAIALGGHSISAALAVGVFANYEDA